MIGRLWRAWCAVMGMAGAVAAAMLAALWAAGALSPERLQAAARALRGEAAPAPVAAAADGALERQTEASLEQRRQELERLDARLAARQAQLDADRTRAEEAFARLQAERQRMETQRAQAGLGEAEAAANAAIFDRMDAADLIELLKRWDNDAFVLHLRVMRPSRAAEILELLQSDPRFEEFRRPPPGSPKGAPTRLDAILAEMKS